MRDWGARKDLTLAQQHMFLQTSQTVNGHGALCRGKLIWRFEVQPTPFSRIYRIRLEYSINGSPDVFVENPDIHILAGNRDLPHVYDSPTRLCLHMPRTGQWKSTKRLDQTIIPWTFIWLFYFEEWLDSDDWKGGGKHPGDEDTLQSYNRHQRRALAHI